MIRFMLVVNTVTSLSVGEQVFITGEGDELGRWRPDAVPMTRVADTEWQAVLNLRTAAPIEYKVTRGSWATEAVDAGGHPLPNTTVVPEHNGVHAMDVLRWKDENPAAPPEITGDYQIWKNVKSRFLEYNRDVIVWLPPGYFQKPTQTYPVLYMHDGRQIFDPNTSTWGADWQVDEHAQFMILNGEMEETIIVGIDCTDDRSAEYDPARKGPAYLKFLLEELKPRVDAEFRTRPERSYIAGSSMGGLISFYAAWTRPDLFAGAACLSPAFSPRLHEERYLNWVAASRDNLPDISLFLSCGGAGKLEEELLQGTLKMVDALKKAGFPDERMSVRIEAWAEHNEAAWERMTPFWLKFLLGR